MRTSRVACSVAILGILCASATAQESKSTHEPDPLLNQAPAAGHEDEAVLQRALHFADLYNWHASRPYFTKAEQLFEASGDKRNALYARLGGIRAEAFDLLQLLNTGHSGTISTVHANSALQAINRFTSCVLQSGIELPYKAIKASIADSINLLIHVERRHGSRRVQEILSVESYSPTEDSYALKTIFTDNQPTQEKESNQ